MNAIQLGTLNALGLMETKPARKIIKIIFLNKFY
jgi:hypothetical protein